jgi:glutathione S-transferase
MLEWDGVKVAQSLAIARFVARKAGLAGKDDLEQFQADSVIELVRDFQTDFYKTFHVDDKKAAAAKFLAENVPKFLANAEKWLKEHGGEYFVGNQVRWYTVLQCTTFGDS